MNKLTEIKNHKVIYDGEDGKLLLPLNFGAIKEMVPWVEKTEHIKNRIKGSLGFPYIYLSPNNTGYIVLDTESKMPTLYSGSYVVFEEGTGGYRNNTPHKLFAHKKEIANLLKLKYTPKQRIQLNMPYTEEELIGFSKRSQFAKAVYNIIKVEGTEERLREIDKLDNFFGDDVVLKGDRMYGAYSEENMEKIEFFDGGIELFTPEKLYKEKYLAMDEDNDWPFDAAMRNWDDCEEIDDDELTYIDHHFTHQTNSKFLELVNRYEPDYWESEGIDPTEGFNSEGVYDNFLSQYFSQDWDNNSWEVLEAIGCAVWRARQQAVKDEIDSELTYEIEEDGDGYITKISYPQLLQLIGSLGLNNFSELREWDINEIQYNLTDTWYDAWDIDKEGLDQINYSMMSILNNLDDKYGDKYKEVKHNELWFKKIMDDLGFDDKKSGWHKQSKWEKNIFFDDPQQSIRLHGDQTKLAAIIRVEDFKPIENTVSMSTIYIDESYRKNQPKDYHKKTTLNVDKIATEVTNFKIPFPEEETKN